MDFHSLPFRNSKVVIRPHFLSFKPACYGATVPHYQHFGALVSSLTILPSRNAAAFLVIRSLCSSPWHPHQ
jgi:hypothetical protein